MPSHYRGLAFFYNVAKRLDAESSVEGNILNEALNALKNRGNVSENHVINMPSFKVDSNIDVEKHLRKVITLGFYIEMYYNMKIPYFRYFTQ